MDLFALLIGAVAILAFAFSLGHAHQPPSVYQFQIVPEPAPSSLGSLLTVGIVALVVLAWLLASL